MSNPIADLTKKEWWVWIGSVLIIIMSNLLSESFDPLTLVAACVGVTSLIFAAKGNVWSQILILASISNPRYLSVTIIFIIFFFYDIYGFINWKKRENNIMTSKQWKLQNSDEV